jgi:hypothetical protein
MRSIYPGRPLCVKPNRHNRRKAAAFKRAHNDFYHRYVQHLPQVPLDAPYEPGTVTHFVTHHDDWCRFYQTGKSLDCNCNPYITRHGEPVRS